MGVDEIGLRFASIHSVGARPEAVDESLDGFFWLGRDRIALRAPIDWWQAPYDAGGYRAFFENSFVFADPVLSSDRFPVALANLVGVFDDWLTANPRQGAEHPHRYAWHDHAASGRLVYMSFALGEGVRRRLLDRGLAVRLAEGVIEHADFLLADENYVGTHNHGMFSDAALALAARNLALSPQVDAWRRLAEERFAVVLRRTVSSREGIHLEHSPYYQWVVHGALSRFAEAGIFPSLELEAMVARMEEAGGWLVAPDGTLPPMGDTPLDSGAPRSVARAAGLKQGLRVFTEAGYAAVRDGDSYLAVTAAHHPTAHKHADDGSFCLYEGGAALVLDSGDPGHDYRSKERLYGVSPAAHATACVDEFDWARDADPYGSGLIGSASLGGLHAVLTENPVAVAGRRVARRALVYSPSRFLIVFDLVDANEAELLERHIPLAPGVEAVVGESGVVSAQRGDAVVGRLASLSGAEGPDRVAVVSGRWTPPPRGFIFPTPGEAAPRTCVTFSGHGGYPRALLDLNRPLGDRLAPTDQ